MKEKKDGEYGDLEDCRRKAGTSVLGIMWVSSRQPGGEAAMRVISPDDLARRGNGVTIVRCERLR